MKFKFKLPPMPHQLSCFERTKDDEYHGYLFEMGTGKTKSAIDNIAYLYSEGKIQAAMVFSNSGSYTNWEYVELPVHWPDGLPLSVYSWNSRDTKTEERKRKEALYSNDGSLKLFAMNIEALAYPRSANIALEFIKKYECMTVIDESTTIKNGVALRTKTAQVLGKLSKYRRIMTGMAVPNGPLDLYSQCQFLKSGAIGFSSYVAFRAHYAKVSNLVRDPLGKLRVPKLFSVLTKENGRYRRAFQGDKNLYAVLIRKSRHYRLLNASDIEDTQPRIIALLKEERSFSDIMQDDFKVLYPNNIVLQKETPPKEIIKKFNFGLQRFSGEKDVKIVDGYKNVEELTERIKSFCTVVTSDEVLDLPPQTYEEYRVELTSEQKRLYSQMRERSIAELNQEQYVTATIALTKILRLHQIVCGHVTDEETGKVVSIKNNRMKALESILNECDNALIWAVHRPEIIGIYEFIKKKFGEGSVAHYFGDTDQESREAAKADFQSGKIRFLVLNPMTGAHGLTLTKTNVSIQYSNSHNFDHRAQLEKRCHRKGQTRAVKYIDLVCPGTVDEKILECLKNKKSLGQQIMVSNWKEFL